MERHYRIVCLLLFTAYLAALIYFTIFAEALGRIPGTESGNPANYNLIPFNEIKRFIMYREQLGWKAVFLNIVGNLAAFIPAGFLIRLMCRSRRGFFKAVLCGFMLSLMIECVQFIFKVGSFDVDDLLLNTLGAFIGALLTGVVMGDGS